MWLSGYGMGTGSDSAMGGFDGWGFWRWEVVLVLVLVREGGSKLRCYIVVIVMLNVLRCASRIYHQLSQSIPSEA